ncbi:hypothetical protein I6B53_10495 [Schaalia sp. 19OD2882]|uniref:hypothetical protein n=1 Tax=Schaalia sp. 19OD2882 TaxID=2794089 RepID=UPI001C1F1E1B|nr:hypothetical protein [Schaalia sp. 19OD2882]QWW19490.1 hypothetical protein I6B53_10495 [Schaalia sp. 19OD2882]
MNAQTSTDHGYAQDSTGTATRVATTVSDTLAAILAMRKERDWRRLHMWNRLRS